MNEDLQSDTIKIRPKRLYRCFFHQTIFPRANVKKDGDGNFRCPRCGQFVSEIDTTTDTGQQLLEIIKL